MVNVTYADYYDLEETINEIQYENILNIIPLFNSSFVLTSAKFIIIYKE